MRYFLQIKAKLFAAVFMVTTTVVCGVLLYIIWQGFIKTIDYRPTDTPTNYR